MIETEDSFCEVCFFVIFAIWLEEIKSRNYEYYPQGLLEKIVLCIKLKIRDLKIKTTKNPKISLFLIWFGNQK